MRSRAVLPGVASRLPQKIGKKKKTINTTQFEFSLYPEAIESALNHGWRNKDKLLVVYTGRGGISTGLIYSRFRCFSRTLIAQKSCLRPNLDCSLLTYRIR